MIDPFEEPLLDGDALDEIETTSRLMIAASGRPGPMTQDEVDEILGITTSE